MENTICKVHGITLNYAMSQLVNFDSIRDMILDTDAPHVITVHTERKIKRKMRKCDGSGLCRHGDYSVRTGRESLPSVVSQAETSRSFRLGPLRLYKRRAELLRLCVKLRQSVSL